MTEATRTLLCRPGVGREYLADPWANRNSAMALPTLVTGLRAMCTPSVEWVIAQPRRFPRWRARDSTARSRPLGTRRSTPGYAFSANRRPLVPRDRMDGALGPSITGRD